MTDRRFEGKRAVVTGAASGIGRATATRLAAEGAAVAVVDVNREGLDQVANEIRAAGGSALAVRADVGSETDVAKAFARCAEEWSGIDVVVANAGIELGDDAAVHALDIAVWERTLRSNLTGMFLTCKYGVRLLLEGGGGAVVLTGSPNGIYGMEVGCHAYSASKGGVHGLARVMANEYARQGIRVNVIIPGFIRTPLNQQTLQDPALMGEATGDIPMRRAGEPEEIAAAIAFLASSDASYAVGTMLTIDGGLTAI